ncbi:MAG: glycoside hydrolase family 9 protein [Sandaracinaceae bacterium]|nr:glycoside hydrolase family 9 protein [Sandaracinaceae bacterium]
MIHTTSYARVVLIGLSCVWLACSSPASADAPHPVVRELASDHIVLGWPAVQGATRMRVLISSEPANAQGALPDPYVVATLSGSASETRIDHLAPNVHVFLRVEADTPRGVVGTNLHAQTPAAARAGLDGAVREVALVAPNVIRIVMGNGDGADFQRGTWRVRRRTGAAIAVRRVHRDSVPVAQMDYELGFGSDADLSETDVDHRIYLELASAVGSREILRIEGPDSTSVLVPYSDRYLETPVIQLNQVGYNPRATERYAYVSMWMGTGGGLSLSAFPQSAETVLDACDVASERRVARTASLPITVRSARDADSGSPVHQIDLRTVPIAENTRIRIRVAGVGVSYPTEVSESAAFHAYYVITRGLLHNRSAQRLGPPITDWVRPLGHEYVFTAEQADAFDFFPENTPQVGRRRLIGGYHDAGDFDQRPMHTVVPQVLMRAFESAPTHFTDSQLNLPERGNRIPDLLDEALWGIATWEQLQESDGGVRSGVESTRHPWGIYSADQDQLVYFTFARNANVSARAAGLFAQASRLLASFDAPRAQRLRERAVRAYNYARSHHASAAFMMYGASELWRLTEQASYKSEFESLWSSIGQYGAFSNFAEAHNQESDYVHDGQVMPDYFIDYLRGPSPSPAIVELSRTWLTRAADDVARRVIESPYAHRNGRPEGRPTGWGQGTVMGRYLDPIIARMQMSEVSASDQRNYFDAMSLSADYVLGANPLGMVFITGLGARSPEEPLHLDSLTSLKNGHGVMPGIPVYGPVPDLPAAEYYRFASRRFSPAFESRPPMLRYADVHSFVTTNEFSVWECMGPHAEHFAMLIGAGQH